MVVMESPGSVTFINFVDFFFEKKLQKTISVELMGQRGVLKRSETRRRGTSSGKDTDSQIFPRLI